MNEKCYFTAGSKIGKYFLNGLAVPEDGFAWLNGKEAEVRFRLMEHIEEEIVVILCLRYVFHPPQRVIFKIGNRVVLDQRIFEPRELRFIVKAEEINQETITFTIEMPDAISPKSVGYNDDERTLSVALESIELKKARTIDNSNNLNPM